jgi:hypothetical protein
MFHMKIAAPNMVPLTHLIIKYRMAGIAKPPLELPREISWSCPEPLVFFRTPIFCLFVTTTFWTEKEQERKMVADYIPTLFIIASVVVGVIFALINAIVVSKSKISTDIAMGETSALVVNEGGSVPVTHEIVEKMKQIGAAISEGIFASP